MLGIAFASCMAVMVVCVLVRWLGITFLSPEKVDALVKGAIWTILVAAATSWFNLVVKRDDSS